MAIHSFSSLFVLHFYVFLLSILAQPTHAAGGATIEKSTPPDPARNAVIRRLIYVGDGSDQPAQTTQRNVAVNEDRPIAEPPKVSTFADLSALSALSTTPVDLANRTRAAAIAGSLTGGLAILLGIALFFLYRKRRRERRQKLRVQRPYYNVNTQIDHPNPHKNLRSRAKTTQPQTPAMNGSLAVAGLSVRAVPSPSPPEPAHVRQKSSKDISLQRRTAFTADSSRDRPVDLDEELGHRGEQGERQWDDIPVREGRFTMSTIYTVSAPPAYEEPSYPLPALPVSGIRTVRFTPPSPLFNHTHPATIRSEWYPDEPQRTPSIPI